MKKIFTFAIVLAGLAALIGFGVNSAKADEVNEVEWELIAKLHHAEVEIDESPFGELAVEINIFRPEHGGEIETVLEVRADGEFVVEGLTEEQMLIEIEFADGIPIKGEVKVVAHLENCGEVNVETKFNLEDLDGFVIEEEIDFDIEGTPFDRAFDIQVSEVEVIQFVVCGFDVLGVELSDSEIAADMGVEEIFIPQFDDED